MSAPRFHVGAVVRVSDPESFLSQFAKRWANRDAVVIENLMDLTNKGREFRGRVLVEFQKRAGRGKTFKEVLNERDLSPADIQKTEAA